MKLLRPTPDNPGAQLELPLAEAAPPAAPSSSSADAALLAPSLDTPPADTWPPALPNGRTLHVLSLIHI